MAESPTTLATLADQLPLYARVPPSLRPRIDSAIERFLKRVEFVGCGGLEVEPRMRLIVAAQASLLVVNRDPRAYDRLYSVLLYPDQFVVEESEEDEAGVVTTGTRALSGQTIDTARIVLSWADVIAGIEGGDGYNVVLHEFAHYLDHELDGAVTTRGLGGPDDWHATLEAEHAALCDAVDAGEDTLIDPYGAEDVVEFFAVATEVYFELPADLLAAHPALYRQLERFYGLDPASWDAPVESLAEPPAD